MIDLLDVLGPTVWRASWQAALLAIPVVLLLWTCGERLAPRWKYLLWSVVVIRLLCVTTPPSPWSAFNLVAWNQPAAMRPIEVNEIPARGLPEPPDHMPGKARDTLPAIAAVNARSPVVIADGISHPAPLDGNHRGTRTANASSEATSIWSSGGWSRSWSLGRIVTTVWLAGVVLLGLRLLAKLLVLRGRLATCRPATDATILKLLEATRLHMGLRYSPQLLVTPEASSPFIYGVWQPIIVVPESILTQSSTTWLRHVLTHELAHLKRGDLWTNWLLLTARILHWFNPVAWWAVQEMRAEREAACDELALIALGETERPGYAATLLDLAVSLTPAALAPGMFGPQAATRRLTHRIRRLACGSTVPMLRTPLCATLLLAMAGIGLTDSQPFVKADQPAAKETPKSETAVETKEPVGANSFVIRGRCLDQLNKTEPALPGIEVRLFQVPERPRPIVEIAKAITDAQGRFEFRDLRRPEFQKLFEPNTYVVLARDPAGNFGMNYRTVFHADPDHRDEHADMRLWRNKATLTGNVVDAQGGPVAGATVAQFFVDTRPVPGTPTVVTDAQGRFELQDASEFRFRDGSSGGITLGVFHPDHPAKQKHVKTFSASVSVALTDGCVVTGTIIDDETGMPAKNAMVMVRHLTRHPDFLTVTDDAGRYRVVVSDGRYNIFASAKDRVAVAMRDQEFVAGNKVELPPIRLISGGLITGKVINTATKKIATVSDSDATEPIHVGIFGPSHPHDNIIGGDFLATVDHTGHYVIRAVPGNNYPYLVNIRGDRMAWDTTKQPPVVVKAGETTHFDLTITPPVPSKNKLEAARKLVASWKVEPTERVTRIIQEFRKLNHTVDETELWCTLMRELVSIGKVAVPKLCEELDQTTNQAMLRRLGFALRAIDDPRAVPALIRSIPKTLLPSSSDYGLIVDDPELSAFMQKYDLNAGGAGGTHFDLGRPVREITAALRTLTKRVTDDSEIYGIMLSEDPRRQVLQRRIYMRHAQEWQAWWDMHAKELTNDPAAQSVNLVVTTEELPPAVKTLGPNARITGGSIGGILSPAASQGQHVTHFADLNTGYHPKWPAHIPKDESKIDQQQLADWAAKNGVDLMCITHVADDGKRTYVLRTFGMSVKEISARDARNIDKLIPAGKLPEGREVGELLMHYDAESQKLIPNANGTFVFTTNEGSMGLIKVTDRITRTADLTGLAAGDEEGGVGFFKGVRYDIHTIIP